jgi:DNA-binding response OmpR family regulator
VSIKILIVDDEPSLLRIISYALEAEGYEIVTAENGAEALIKVKANQPDLLILDVKLPEISGIEVCRQLRTDPEMVGLPIIMLSARIQIADKIAGLKVGADEYITKPVDTDELVARVAALLERTRRLRDTQPVQRGKVLTFVGAKGGIGATTVALNFAAALTKQMKTVIMVELTSSYGALALQLQHQPSKNLGNLRASTSENSLSAYAICHSD